MGIIMMMYNTLKCFGEGRKKGCAINKILICTQRHTDDGCGGLTWVGVALEGTRVTGKRRPFGRGFLPRAVSQLIWEPTSEQGEPATNWLLVLPFLLWINTNVSVSLASGLINSSSPSGSPANSNWSIHSYSC